jgi:hypothetical protein
MKRRNFVHGTGLLALGTVVRSAFPLPAEANSEALLGFELSNMPRPVKVRVFGVGSQSWCRCSVACQQVASRGFTPTIDDDTGLVSLGHYDCWMPVDRTFREDTPPSDSEISRYLADIDVAILLAETGRSAEEKLPQRILERASDSGVLTLAIIHEEGEGDHPDELLPDAAHLADALIVIPPGDDKITSYETRQLIDVSDAVIGSISSALAQSIFGAPYDYADMRMFLEGAGALNYATGVARGANATRVATFKALEQLASSKAGSRQYTRLHAFVTTSHEYVGSPSYHEVGSILEGYVRDDSALIMLAACQLSDYGDDVRVVLMAA